MITNFYMYFGSLHLLPSGSTCPSPPPSRYSMRRRHPSGSSGIVEQLTQSYMARKEQIASPPTTPTSGSRLRSPLGGRWMLELGGEPS